MTEIAVSKELVARCGLYCGACGRYQKGACPGCAENNKAGWCKVRSCCGENSYATCADCTDFDDPRDCSKFNNFISKAFGLLFNSNRAACIMKIKEIGVEDYATLMAENKRQSLPRK